MPEISLYNAWTMKLPLPEPFEKLAEKTKKKRVSYCLLYTSDAADE